MVRTANCFARQPPHIQTHTYKHWPIVCSLQPILGLLGPADASGRHDLRLDSASLAPALRAFHSDAGGMRTSTARDDDSGGVGSSTWQQATSPGTDGSAQSNGFAAPGTLYVFNSPEAFKRADKQGILNVEGARIWDDIVRLGRESHGHQPRAIAAQGHLDAVTIQTADGINSLCRFVLLVYANLKDHSFVYWFGVPALVKVQGQQTQHAGVVVNPSLSLALDSNRLHQESGVRASAASSASPSQSPPLISLLAPSPPLQSPAPLTVAATTPVSPDPHRQQRDVDRTIADASSSGTGEGGGGGASAVVDVCEPFVIDCRPLLMATQHNNSSEAPAVTAAGASSVAGAAAPSPCQQQHCHSQSVRVAVPHQYHPGERQGDNVYGAAGTSDAPTCRYRITAATSSQISDLQRAYASMCATHHNAALPVVVLHPVKHAAATTSSSSSAAPQVAGLHPSRTCVLHVQRVPDGADSYSASAAAAEEEEEASPQSGTIHSHTLPVIFEALSLHEFGSRLAGGFAAYTASTAVGEGGAAGAGEMERASHTVSVADIPPVFLLLNLLDTTVAGRSGRAYTSPPHHQQQPRHEGVMATTAAPALPGQVVNAALPWFARNIITYLSLRFGISSAQLLLLRQLRTPSDIPSASSSSPMLAQSTLSSSPATRPQGSGERASRQPFSDDPAAAQHAVTLVELLLSPPPLLLSLFREESAALPELERRQNLEQQQLSGLSRVLPAGLTTVGWETNDKGRPAPRLFTLKSHVDPVSIADASVDLNLSLMRWRMLPELNLERISGTRCLLLGAGTLGCHAARSLLAWGFRHFTFVDNGRVNYSNPVRQPLFEFRDAAGVNTAGIGASAFNGGGSDDAGAGAASSAPGPASSLPAHKAVAAAAALKRIHPSVHAVGVVLEIPLPGHPVPSSSRTAASSSSSSSSSAAASSAAAALSSVAAPTPMDEVQASVQRLESLIRSHDVVLQMTDTRESRWLPTLLCAANNKPCMNIGLGFDSLLVMRHGMRGASGSGTTGADSTATGGALKPASESEHARASDTVDTGSSAAPTSTSQHQHRHQQQEATPHLGCYFCTDVSSVPGHASVSALNDRSMDQQCTVTRPGCAPIACALAVELLVALLHHPSGFGAPADAGAASSGYGSRPTQQPSISVSTDQLQPPASSSSSPLGVVPHQIRFFLSSFQPLLCSVPASPFCTACSPVVVDAYKRGGMRFLFDVFNDTGVHGDGATDSSSSSGVAKSLAAAGPAAPYAHAAAVSASSSSLLERITGLDALRRETDAAASAALALMDELEDLDEEAEEL